MSHKAWVTFIISLFLWSAANAQQRTLTGKVVADKSNRPIEFASVQVKDHELWAFTDQQGLFTIKNAPNGTLALSMDKMKKYLTKAYGQSITHDDYWDTMMYEWLRHGIDYHTGFLDILNSVTSDEVQQCAKDMLNANRRIEITQMSE